MPLSTAIALLQDARLATSGRLTPAIRVVSGVLALVMVFVIIYRRKGRAKNEEDNP